MADHTLKAIHRAYTNIALIKYWGKRNQSLLLPMTSSLSLTLEALYTDTSVQFDSSLECDSFYLDGQLQSDDETQKVSRFVNLFRKEAQIDTPIRIDSVNHVPTAAGLASSSSAYAALASALNDALDLNLDAKELSTFARRGSGSATRSLFGGLAMWHRGDGDDSRSSYGEQIDDAQWDIGMLIVLVNADKKKVSSRQGMQHTVTTSPFYELWPQEVEKDLTNILIAIKDRNIVQMGQIAEHNAMKMHATMLAANPSFNYFQGKTLEVIEHVKALRDKGFDCYYTMDAGPNVKILCPFSQMEQIRSYLRQTFTDDQLIISKPGPAPHRINSLESIKEW